MNLKGLLPQDVEMLREYVEQVVSSVSVGNIETDVEIDRLVRCSLGRIAANRVREEYPKLPGEGWASALPPAREEYHVLDWFVSSIIEGERSAWLRNVDERGRPRKLMKCSSYDDLVREADRYFEKRRGKMAKVLGPDDEAFEADLGDGYTLMRMLTPEALDLESSRMNHCIGHGSYDGRLRTGWGRFLSVRDRKRRPAATVELRQEPNAKWSISQIAGKRNGRPAKEVMDAIRAYAVAQDWWGRDHWWPTVTMSDGTECDIDRIPEGATIRQLDEGLMGMSPDLRLPDGLTVLESIVLSPLVRLPENMTVKGVLEFARRIEGDPPIVLPESLIAREIRICSAEDIARPIPTHLVHRIHCRIRKLTGHSFASLQWVEEEQSLGEEHEGPSPRT